MSGRVSPLSFRLSQYNQFNTTHLYDFENKFLTYADDLNRNTFLFNFLQNELLFLRFKVLRVRVLPKVNGTTRLQALVLSNHLKFKRLRHRYVRNLVKRFRTCFFFLINISLLKLTLRRLRKHFIKYSYSRGVRLHRKYFKKFGSGIGYLRPVFFNLKNNIRVLSYFHRFARSFFFVLLKSPSVNKWQSKITLFFTVLMRFYLCGTLKKPINWGEKLGAPLSLFNVDAKPSVTLVKKKIVAHRGTHKKHQLTRSIKPRFVKKKRAFFKIIMRFYKFFTRAMFAQSFTTKNVFAQHNLQHLLRHVLNEDVKIIFSHFDLRQPRNSLQKNVKVNRSLIQRFLRKNNSKTAHNFIGIRKRVWLTRFLKSSRYQPLFFAFKKTLASYEYKRLYRKYPNFKKNFYYFLFALYNGDTRLFNYAFSAMFKYLKQHRPFLWFISKQLRYYLGLPFIKKRITGLIIRLRGKLNGSDRRKTYYIKIGFPILAQKITSNVNYNLTSVETFTGSFGLRTWFHLA